MFLHMRTSLVLKDILGTSERFAGYVLQGKRKPGPRAAKRLADALGIPLEQILLPDEWGIDLPTLIKKRLIAKPTTSAESGGATGTS